MKQQIGVLDFFLLTKLIEDTIRLERLLKFPEGYKEAFQLGAEVTLNQSDNALFKTKFVLNE